MRPSTAKRLKSIIREEYYKAIKEAEVQGAEATDQQTAEKMTQQLEYLFKLMAKNTGLKTLAAQQNTQKKLDVAKRFISMLNMNKLQVRTLFKDLVSG